MNFWMASMLWGIAFSGLVTLCVLAAETLLLPGHTREIVVLFPLRPQKGYGALRRGLAWLEGRRGIFPGCAAAVDLGLDPQEAEACRIRCEKSGVEFLQGQELASFIAKTVGKDYTGTGT